MKITSLAMKPGRRAGLRVLKLCDTRATTSEALLGVRNNATDSIARTETQALAEEVGFYCIQIYTVVWYDILHAVNHVSKLLWSPTVHFNVAVNLLTKRKDSLISYINIGFVAAQVVSRDICEEKNVEAVLKEKTETYKKSLGL